MSDWLEKAKLGNQEKGILNFGAVPAQSWANQLGGVSYANATSGSQVYAASSLVSR